MTPVLIAAFAVASGGFLKGVTGLGFPLVAIPILATVTGVADAIVLTTIPSLVINALMIKQIGSAAETNRAIDVVVWTGLGGTVVGTLVLTTVHPAVPALSVAVIVIAYLIVRLALPNIQTSGRVERYLSPPVGVIAGIMQGATGVSGPLIGVYIHSLGMRREGYFAGMSKIFQAYLAVQLITLIALGHIGVTEFLQSLALSIPAAAMVGTGMSVSRRMSPKVFEISVLALLFICAVKLIIDVIMM